jgi:transmembrane sensor
MELSERELLKKFLDNTYTPEEWQEIQLLLQRSEVQEALEKLTWKDWLEDVKPSGRKQRRMLQGIRARLDDRLKERPDGKAEAVRRMPAASILRFAAVWMGVVLAIGLALVCLNRSTRINKEQVALQRMVNQAGIPVHYVLPDGSEVFLGAGSVLTYPTGFSGSERRIDLSGEAFFSVKHNADKPFVVYTEDLRTTDVGTSFKIEAFKGHRITVAVASGKVSVSRQEQGVSRQVALLTPGRMVLWDRSAQKALIDEEDISSLDQWTTGALIFEKETMRDVARTLERRYGVTILLEDSSVEQYRVTGTFSAGQPVGDILKMLSMLGKFHFEPNGKSGFTINHTK